MSGKTIAAVVLALGTALFVGLSVADPNITPDDLLGIILSRFAWTGAGISAVLWAYALRQIWAVEGSLHHLVARTLSALTIIALDGAVLIFFWPDYLLAAPLQLTLDQTRILIAFIVGASISAALWQVTAPRQARVPRAGHRY